MTTTLPSQMAALLAREQAHGPDRMSLEDRARPEPGVGDVLIQVGAASFTPTELQWPSTWVDRSGRDRRPVIPGHEVSGTVVGLGYGATGFGVGDEVFGLTDWYRDGSLAEFVVVEARNLAGTPGSLSPVDAAAFPMAALTAWQALFVHAGLEADQTVVIHGAAGVLYRSSPMVRAGGSIVSVVEASNDERADVNNVFFVVEPNGEQLTELARRIETLRPVVGKVGTLADGPRLWAEKIAGGIPGKVVLTSS